MKNNNKELGDIGENIAKEYLENKGYNILEQNYRNKYGEIDLVAHRGKKLVFVEVKTRIGERLGLPEDAVNSDKIKRLINNSIAYVSWNKKAKDFNSYRIDSVCIVLGENKEIKRINHYENITS